MGLLMGCGTAPEDGLGDDDGSTEPRLIEYEDSELDAPSLIGRSGSLCKLPEITLGKFVPLDKQLFVETLSDYAVGWMQPLHEGLLGLDEQAFLDTSIEAVASTFVMGCRTVPDYEFLPPDEELLDPEVQQDFRGSIAQLFEGATVVPTGDDSLRLEIHECADCGGPIGTKPSYVVARLTEDGVLALEYELNASTSWSKTLYITREAVVAQGKLGPLADWSDGLTEGTRNGSLTLPNGRGTLTVLARKDDEKGMSVEVGVSDFELILAPGEENETHLNSSSPCVGFTGQLDITSGSADFGLLAGTLDLETPGTLHCPYETSCAEPERNGTFAYHTEDLAFVAEDPENGSSEAARASLVTGGSQTSAINGAHFSEFGLGAEGAGGFSVAVTDTPEGMRVVFEPALNLSGALTISAFSEAFRLDLPEWLSDEVFDISFGGDPKPSLLVPHRQTCQSGDPAPTRRLVKVETGTVTGNVGAGRHSITTAGQCMGKTLSPEASLASTTDWVDAPLECE